MNNNRGRIAAALAAIWMICAAVSSSSALASESSGSPKTGVLPGWLTPEAVEEDEPPRYGKTNIKGVNVRAKPDQRSAITVKAPISGTVVEITGEDTDKNGVVWYKALLSGKRGFVRSDLVDEMTEEENALYIEQQKLEQQKQAARANTKTASARSHASSSPYITHAAPGTSTQSGSPYPPGTTVFISSNGVYHSAADCACGYMDNLTTSTLASAQAQGLSACNYCWCLDCLFPDAY
ncbi:MAG: SH3 domain-containing protein [Oscillospiraceae bacterium]|jgi:hypothetical protein|nr:SH3 domain-containing protein [Oscillospiraceae bacterium]